MREPSLTLGLEEEYQVVDPVSGELRSYIKHVLRDGQVIVDDLKPELHQSIVEVGSRVCETPAQIREEVVRLRREVMDHVARENLTIMASGTHPFSSWLQQEITPLERYLHIEADLQDLARKNLIFGCHVHVGIDDRDFLIDTMGKARFFLPHLLALSASSPFWRGRYTGLRSYRSVVFRNFPRTGTPPHFDSWADYTKLLATLIRSNSIEDSTKIWWDIRPSHTCPTLEFRICDMCTRVDEAVCMAAIIQAMVAKLWKLHKDGLTFRELPLALLSENKWRAVRYGVDGRLIDLGWGQEVPTRVLIHQLVGEFLDDVLDDLGSRAEVEYAYTILEDGASADRQLRIYRETGDLREVVGHLIQETASDIQPPGPDASAEAPCAPGAP